MTVSFDDFPVATEFVVPERAYLGNGWDHAPSDLLFPPKVGHAYVLRRQVDPQPGMLKFKVHLVPARIVAGDQPDTIVAGTWAE